MLSLTEGDLIIGLGSLGDRHPGGAQHPLHDAAASAADGGLRCHRAGQEWSRPWRLRCCSAMKDAIAAKIATLPQHLRQSLDVGSRQGARPACSVHRHRTAGVSSPIRTVRGSGAPREHQWPSTAVLSEGNRPIALGRRRDRRGRDSAQQPTSQDTRLEEHPPKPSTITYSHSNQPVLPRPLEPGLARDRSAELLRPCDFVATAMLTALLTSAVSGVVENVRATIIREKQSRIAQQ